jgi:hypothetical protein
MAIRIPSLMIVSVLAGCTSNGVVASRGVYLNRCVTHTTVEQTRPASCMTRAEYRTARKKAQHSQDETAADMDEEVKEVEAVDSRSRIGIP